MVMAGYSTKYALLREHNPPHGKGNNRPKSLAALCLEPNCKRGVCERVFLGIGQEVRSFGISLRRERSALYPIRHVAPRTPKRGIQEGLRFCVYESQQLVLLAGSRLPRIQIIEVLFSLKNFRPHLLARGFMLIGLYSKWKWCPEICAPGRFFFVMHPASTLT